MTTSISRELVTQGDREAPPIGTLSDRVEEVETTLAGRFIILTLCIALITTAMAFGTGYGLALAVFQATSTVILILWAVDAWGRNRLLVSSNPLPLYLLGLVLLGLAQLLPLGDYILLNGAFTRRTISLDPFSTRLSLVQITSLLIYFAAALTFISTPKRLRVVTKTIVVFGFLLAIFAIIQSFVSPHKIYWIRDVKDAIPFGPFVNRHHFAGYMEVILALTAGLIVARGIEWEKSFLYLFAALIMAVSIIMTGSRGGMIALLAMTVFMLSTFSVGKERRGSRRNPLVGIFLRLGIGLSFFLVVLMGAIIFGGEDALTRILGSVNQQDPSSGRLHFWSTALDIIRAHPLIGVGLGAFGVAYTQHDTRNAVARLEQAHNDYLQLLTDAGIVGGLLGVAFIVTFFIIGFRRLRTNDRFRRGVALGATTGCFGLLVHSFFDFPLHLVAVALLFLTAAALATVGSQVEEVSADDIIRTRRKRKRRRRTESEAEATSSEADLTSSLAV